MSTDDIEIVGRLEARLRDMEQILIPTTHHFHAGLYARTIRIPKGVVITGALIKISTMLIVSGHASVFVGGDVIDLRGYNVLPASAGRKQVFLAHVDTDLTMIFPSRAATVDEAEAEFTDETDLLMSRDQQENLIIITGE